MYAISSEMTIRKATDADWEEIWPIFHEVVAAGDTYAYDTINPAAI